MGTSAMVFTDADEEFDDEGPELTIPEDKLAFIIEKAREFDVKEADSDPDSGSNPTDDGSSDILEDKASDPTRQELYDAIRGLNADQRIELIALAWVGRGTYDIEEWDEALDTAQAEYCNLPAHFLMSMPLLGDYIEAGLEEFDEGIVDEDEELEGPSEE